MSVKDSSIVITLTQGDYIKWFRLHLKRRLCNVIYFAIWNKLVFCAKNIGYLNGLDYCCVSF